MSSIISTFKTKQPEVEAWLITEWWHGIEALFGLVTNLAMPYSYEEGLKSQTPSESFQTPKPMNPSVGLQRMLALRERQGLERLSVTFGFQGFQG